MDTLTSIYITIMPIIQHPLFKIGCYILAILTIISLTYFFTRSRKKAREALKNKEITHVTTPWSTVILIIFFLSLSFGILAEITDWNEPGKITVLDNGRVITDAKPYFTLGTKPSAIYDQKQTYAPAKKREKRGKEEPVLMTFNDYGKARADYQFVMELPREPEKIRLIHEQYDSQEKLLSAGAKPFINEAVKIGAMLLRSEESASQKEKRLLGFVKDQLEKGYYVVKEGKILRDDKGEAIRVHHPWLQFDVKFSDFKLANIQYEELVRNLAAERDKIVLELKKVEGFELGKIPLINELQQEVERHLKSSKDLTEEQKKMIIGSIGKARKMIEKLAERSKKPDPQDRNREL